MKRYIYIMMAMLAGAFASCSKEDISRLPGTEGTQSVTINLVADDAVNTRAAATGLSQYIIEVYSDDAYTTAANIFGEGPTATNQATSANGSFSMILDRTSEYHCLFWADKDAAAYTTATLKTVTPAPGTAPAEAWFGTKQISGSEPTQTITLKRAVAKLNLLETGKLIAGTTLTATFDQPTVFNVATGGVTSDSEARTETITTSAISGSKEAPVQLGADYFILSPASTQYVAKVTFKCGEEEAFDVDNVPFQANCATNIKGHYTSLASETFSVSCDDDWNTPDNEVALDPATIWDGKYPASADEAKTWLGEETDGKSEEDGKNHVFTITAARQLAALQYLLEEQTVMTGPTSNTQYSYATYKLATNIDLNNHEWKPIGDNDCYFMGLFDGGDHIISNLRCTSGFYYIGLFGYALNATIQNLSVNGEINCSTTETYLFAGGIIGAITGNGTIEKCINNCSITVTGRGSMYPVGGIIGSVIATAPNCNVYLKDNINNATTITSPNYIGSIVGRVAVTDNAIVTITDCTDNGNLTHLIGDCSISSYGGATCTITVDGTTATNSKPFPVPASN